MISGVSGVSNMTGVLAVQPYRGAQQYMGYAQVKALSQSTAGQNYTASGVNASQGTDAAASAVRSGKGAGASSAAQQAPRIGAVWSGRAANTGVPVEPVDPVKAVSSNEARGIAYAIPFLRKGMDPAELSVRMRMQYMDPSQGKKAAADKAAPGIAGENGAGQVMPGAAEQSAAGVQGVSGEKECQTCKERKYQDGSDDPGVSYQTPTHISPEQAASAVRGHEMEHVVREQASAEREGRRVVSQSVTMHTAICPECGRVYVSGGTTRTTTASDSQPEQPVSEQEADAA
ncbi:MAG: hypothetical protein HFG88_05505 [Dorea sp.]|nr:hypothetical protein [Dorea sp.]